MNPRRLSAWRAAWAISRYRSVLFSFEFVRLVAWNSSILLIGLALQQVFDALGGSGPAGFGAVELVAALAAAEITRLALMWGGTLGDRSRQHMRALLRFNLLRAQLRSGGPDAGTPAASPGDAVSRFRDDVDDFLAFLESATYALGKVVLAVSAMAIMLAVQPVIAVAVVVPLVAVVLATRLARRRIRSHRAAYRNASAAVTGLLGEMFGAVVAVKSAHAGDGVLGHLARLNERRLRAGLRDQLVTRLLGTFDRVAVDLSVGAMLLLAVPMMRRGDFTVGDMALFVSYISGLRWVPHYIGQMLARHRQAEVAIERMTALLPPEKPEALVTHRSLRSAKASDERRPPAMLRERGTVLESLTVCGLTVVHPTSGRGVHDVTLTVQRGTFTVVTGPAGAGKTTLLRGLLGLLPAQAGIVEWNDLVIDDRAEFFVPPRSSYVPQVPRLFSESLRDNVLLGLEDASALRSALRDAILEPDIASMPSGIGTRVGARGVRLSGGQAQRTALARALVRRSDLLVLDDVSSALDVETERRLWDRLLDDTGRTLLVVSNRPATIARADQVVRLDHGHVRSTLAPVAAGEVA
jgi:ATP-binding cassette subfamily B protein